MYKPQNENQCVLVQTTRDTSSRAYSFLNVGLYMKNTLFLGYVFLFGVKKVRLYKLSKMIITLAILQFKYWRSDLKNNNSE